MPNAELPEVLAIHEKVDDFLEIHREAGLHVQRISSRHGGEIQDAEWLNKKGCEERSFNSFTIRTAQFPEKPHLVNNFNRLWSF